MDDCCGFLNDLNHQSNADELRDLSEWIFAMNLECWPGHGVTKCINRGHHHRGPGHPEESSPDPGAAQISAPI
ncbi:hypothetical protein GA0115259_101061 [Streptomyces sp. MnatMP-M17]|nr:hypothetical protein GA0115259_101061 [Streptomyces sp. MnatMP-M17]